MRRGARGRTATTRNHPPSIPAPDLACLLALVVSICGCFIGSILDHAESLGFAPDALARVGEVICSPWRRAVESSSARGVRAGDEHAP